MQIKTKLVSCHTADSKPVKQEVNVTVIPPPLVFLERVKFPGKRGRERESCRICPFLFLKGMTGALAPFGYQVLYILVYD